MDTTIRMRKVEVAPSPELGIDAYRKDFEVSCVSGVFGSVPALLPQGQRSRVMGTLTVDIPLDQAGEVDLFGKAREALHVALTSLAEARAPPWPE